MSQEKSALSAAAFQAIVDAAPEGILVLREQIVFANAKTEKLFAYDPGELLGQPVEALVPELSQDLTARESPEDAGLQLRALRKDGSDFQVTVSFNPVETEGGQFLCCVIRKAAALDPATALEGLLRICASCKKIRHDAGRWEDIESYLLNHTKLKFSHGMCPDCSQRWYPEHFKK
jgi:PAS domain S-box-containing protein